MLESPHILLIGFKYKDSQRAVTGVRLAAFRSLDGHGPSSNYINHWVCFLEIEGEKSVLLDMSVGSDFTTAKGVLLVSSVDTVVYPDVVHVEHFALTGEKLTVENVIDGIIERKRDAYSFTWEGIGSRWWQYIFLKDLQREGRLADGCAETAFAAMEKFYGDDGKVIGEKKPVLQGVFYELE
jgi:hypothetical protein